MLAYKDDKEDINFLVTGVWSVCSRKLVFGEHANRISEDLVICDYCWGANQMATKRNGYLPPLAMLYYINMPQYYEGYYSW